MRERAEARANDILDVVIDLIESEGYEAVQVRTVAKRARISLSTMYKLFGTQDELIVAALERWMDAHAYATLTMPEPGESPYDTLVRVLRTVFEPWEQHPRVLIAYDRARNRPTGQRLNMKGLAVVEPIAREALANADDEFFDDLKLIYSHVVRAVIGRFAAGEIEITEVLPILERTLYRLMTGVGLDVGAAPRAITTTKSQTRVKARRKSASRRSA